MWDLPGPGLEPVSPAVAGGFLTTAPPGKPINNVLKGDRINVLFWFGTRQPAQIKGNKTSRWASLLTLKNNHKWMQLSKEATGSWLRTVSRGTWAGVTRRKQWELDRSLSAVGLYLCRTNDQSLSSFKRHLFTNLHPTDQKSRGADPPAQSHKAGCPMLGWAGPPWGSGEEPASKPIHAADRVRYLHGLPASRRTLSRFDSLWLSLLQPAGEGFKRLMWLDEAHLHHLLF